MKKKKKAGIVIVLVIIAAVAGVFLWLFLSGRLTTGTVSETASAPPVNTQFSSATDQADPLEGETDQNQETAAPSAVLDVDPDSILTELPVSGDMGDGEYTAQITNVFKVDEGYALDLDELEETGDQNYNDSNIIVFVPVSEEVQYSEDGDVQSEDIAGFEAVLAEQNENTFYTVTIKNGMVTEIEYAGDIDSRDE